MKALDEYILMVLLKRIHFLTNVTTQMKALSSNGGTVFTLLLMNRVHIFGNFVFNLDRNVAVKELDSPGLRSPPEAKTR